MARPAVISLLVATTLAYLWNLSASGDANSFYAAAVQAATKSWKALFFGSIDSSNFITVDKPPASLWVMALSGRIFGFSNASMLVPQVLEGVIAVGLLSASVKRWFGAGAGLLAGTLLALTPVVMTPSLRGLVAGAGMAVAVMLTQAGSAAAESTTSSNWAGHGTPPEPRIRPFVWNAALQWHRSGRWIAPAPPDGS